MLVVNKQITQTRVNFTPDAFKKAYKAFQNGEHSKLIAMMKETLTDSQVKGCLIGRQAGFRTDIVVSAYDDTDSDKERATWLKNVFYSIDLRKLFKATHEALLYKYVVIDFEWEGEDGKQFISGFKKYDQKYFAYEKGTDELKVRNDQNKLEEIPEEVLVCESDEPLMIPVLRDFILKNFGVESWASFLETFGEPFIIGDYPANATDEIKQELEQAVNDLGASSRATKPDNTNITTIESNRGTTDHSKFTEACNTGISIAILGHAGATKNEQTFQVGENLAAYRVKREIALDDMDFIEICLRKIAKWMIDRNFGDGRYPKLSLDKAEPVNTAELRENLDTAYNHGVKLHISNYKKLGIEVSDDDEFIQKQPNSLGF